MKIPRGPRQPLPGLLLFAAVGIIAAEYCAPWKMAIPVAVALLAAFAGVGIFRRSTMAVLLCTACAFFLLHRIAELDDPGRDLAPMFAGKPLVKATGIVITAPQEKQSAKGAVSSEFQLRLESIEIDGATTRASTVVLARWTGGGPGYGDRVSIVGEADNLPPPRNPGEFDYAGYMHRLGIYSEITMLDATSGDVVSGGHGNPLVAFALRTRHWVQEKLKFDLEDSPDVSGLVQGLTLGLKSETPEETREMFQRTGTLHLFVVNGLHIGMFIFIAFMLVRLCGAGRVLSILIVIPLVCFYALLTGSSTGSIRAAIMATILLAGLLADGKPVILNNLAAAGFVILAWNTNELFMPGFQFSMGVVFAIILIAGPLQNWLGKFGQPDPFLPRGLWNRWQKLISYCTRHIAGTVAVSFAASVGSLPFSVEYFGLAAPSSLAANTAIVPMAFLILMEGMLSTIAGIFSNTVSALFNNVNWALAHAVLWTVHFFAQIPYGHFYMEVPTFQRKPACEISVLDLGDGGAIHVRSAGCDWLVDCGNVSPYDFIVRNYLHSRGVNRLDGFVVSHGNSKFIGAATAVEADFTPAISADSPLDDRSPARRAFHQWLTDHGAARTTLKRGDEITVSATTKIHVLHPPPDTDATRADDKTLIMRLDCAGCRVLFMCGSGSVAEQWLVANEPDLQCDILIKSPHTGESMELLNMAQPKVIICPCSNTAAAARIDEAWATDVSARGIRLFRQDETGAVNVKLDAGMFTVRAFMSGQVYSGAGGGSK